MPGAVLRSETGSLVRSPSGAFIRGASPPEVAGHIVATGANEGPIAFDGTTGAYRILGANLPGLTKVAWAGGQLFGYAQGDWQVYVFNAGANQWDPIGASLPLGPIRDLIAHNDQAYVASGSTVFLWTGSDWSEFLRYDADQIRVPNLDQSTTIQCDTVAIADCIPLRSRVEIFTSSVPAYIGVYDVEEISGFSVGVRLPFSGAATGTMATEHGGVDTFTTVVDGQGEIIFFQGTTGAATANAGAPYPQALVSQSNRLYVGGFGWEPQDFTKDNLNAHPILADDGAVIAVMRRPIDHMVGGYFGAFLFQLGDQPSIEWRDTYPGCCQRLPDPAEPGDHFQWNSSTALSWWAACQAADAFDPANVSNPFETGGDQPFIGWLYTFANIIYAPIRYGDGQLQVTFEQDHPYVPGSVFTLDDESRYYRKPTVEIVLDSRNVVIDSLDYRGSGRVGCWDGNVFPIGSPDRYVAAIAKYGGNFNGLFRWTGAGWQDAAVDRNWAEGLPGPHPLITQQAGAWFSEVDHSITVDVNGVGYALTDNTLGHGSVEGLRGGIFYRFCFPALSFPLEGEPPNKVIRIYALPPGALIPDLAQSCPGTSVTTSSAGTSNTINMTTGAHGLNGASQIEIVSSTVSGYLGVKNIAEVISPTELRVRDTFEGDASGTWEEVGNPDNNGTFSTVADGGVWDYWFTYIETGLDVRPADLRITGDQSGLVIDFGGIGWDYVKREIVPGGVRGQHEARYNRLGQTDGPGTTHFYRLEYPDGLNPGWIIGETVTLSRV